MAERQTVALDVVGSTPTTHPKFPFAVNQLKTGACPLDGFCPQRHLNDLAVRIAHRFLHDVAVVIERGANVPVPHEVFDDRQQRVCGPQPRTVTVPEDLCGFIFQQMSQPRLFRSRVDFPADHGWVVWPASRGKR